MLQSMAVVLLLLLLLRSASQHFLSRSLTKQGCCAQQFVHFRSQRLCVLPVRNGCL
jgi:hypothetical protein